MSPESHESSPQPHEEHERSKAIWRLVEDYFPDDLDFMLTQLQDEEDDMNFLYGQLLFVGEDPDEIFKTYGVFQE